MSKAKLLSSCGAAALLAVSAGAAFGQSMTVGDVTQKTKNTNSVTNTGTVSVGGIHGDGSSASVSATGAASAVTLQSINGPYTGGGKLKAGDVKQKTKNHGNVTNYGIIDGYATGVSGHGASASVSATGAQSAVSLSRIGGSYSSTLTKVGNIKQKTKNFGNVKNDGVILNTYYGLASGLSGNGSSVSVSATGAASVVSASSINTGGKDTVKLGRIKQTTKNKSDYVTNYGYIPGSYWGNLSGHGSSVSVSATGAASSVSVSRIASAPLKFAKIGKVKQHTLNTADVTNQHAGVPYGSFTGDYDGTMSLGHLSGTGSSASISATGAASAVSYSSIEQSYPAWNYVVIRGVKQTTVNTGDVQNTGPTDSSTTVRHGSSGVVITTTTTYGPAAVHVRDLSGAGSSASVSATGAASIVGISKINDAASTISSIGYVTQSTTNSGNVSNYGSLSAGHLSGNGASVSISATGAVSSVSYSNINSGWGRDSFAVGPVVQDTYNSGDVTNVGGANHRTRETIRPGRPPRVTESSSYRPATLSAGHLKGAGTSASISATGAVSAASSSAISGGGDTVTFTKSVTQGTINSGKIVNWGTAYVGSLYGAGASVSISAMGAASSVAISKIDNKGWMYAATGPVIQVTHNSGRVKNTGNIRAGSLYGNGSSASVSATGAASQMSVTRINGGSITAKTASISQLTINLASVTNRGSITAGYLSGHGSSASVAAAGAVSQASTTSICNGCGSSFRTGPINQITLNTGRVRNNGTVNVGRITGAGASAGVSALGAGSVVSGSIISKARY